MADSVTRALDNLRATLLRLVPAMQVRPTGYAAGCAKAVRCDAMPTSAIMEQITQYCARRSPEAGRHYWTLRCWGMLIWQPVYLNVIAVYHSDILPLSRHVELQLREEPECALMIGHHVPLQGTRAQRMQWACEQIGTLCDRFRQALADVVRINVRACLCMLADCILQALLLARVDDPGISCARLRQRAQQWLRLCGLEDRSGYFIYAQGDRPALAVQRQVCCHHYRCHGAQRCATCPALSTDERIARLTFRPA